MPPPPKIVTLPSTSMLPWGADHCCLSGITDDVAQPGCGQGDGVFGDGPCVHAAGTRPLQIGPAADQIHVGFDACEGQRHPLHARCGCQHRFEILGTEEVGPDHRSCLSGIDDRASRIADRLDEGVVAAGVRGDGDQFLFHGPTVVNACGSGTLVEGMPEIVEEIIDVLDADAQSHQIIGHLEGGSGRRGVGHHAGVFDQLSTAPSDSASVKIRVLSMMRIAASRPPAARNDTMPPKPLIWRAATS